MANIYTAQSDSLIETLASHIFKDYGKELGNNIIDKNFLLKILEKKSKVNVVGGLDFTETVMTSENTNFAFRDAKAEIASALQDPTRTLAFEPMTLTGTIVINEKHKAMNSGKAAIRSLLKTLQEQADTTVENVVSDAMWDASPTSGVDPDSILTLVSATPTTGSIGGVSRVTNTWARNAAYTTAISDIGSEAGITTLHAERINLAGPISSLPDIAVTTGTLFSGLWGYMDGKRQVKADEQMVKLGFDNFYLGSALLGFDPKCPAGYFYYLNSKNLNFKILDKMNYVFEPFSRKDNSLNSTSIFYLGMNMTTNLPGANKVFTSVSTS